MIFGALNLRNGHLVLVCRKPQRAADFCAFLTELRRRCRDRPLALLLDEDSSHTAHVAWRLATTLNLALLWLPLRSSELNPVEHLWRAAKQNVRANRQNLTIEHAVTRFLRYLLCLTPRTTLRKAGVLAPCFGLRNVVSK